MVTKEKVKDCRVVIDGLVLKSNLSGLGHEGLQSRSKHKQIDNELHYLFIKIIIPFDNQMVGGVVKMSHHS